MGNPPPHEHPPLGGAVVGGKRRRAEHLAPRRLPRGEWRIGGRGCALVEQLPHLEGGAMAVAANGSRFGYILDLLKRDKVREARPWASPCGGPRRRHAGAPASQPSAGTPEKHGEAAAPTLMCCWAGIWRVESVASLNICGEGVELDSFLGLMYFGDPLNI